MTTQEKAAEMWTSFDRNQKAGVRFGMFPFDKMTEAEKQGYDGRELSIALMNQAKQDGGMRA
jgi:hypothetical protein